ncbi:MAG: glycosyltransferase [Tepidisphaeraceae bacterium]
MIVTNINGVEEFVRDGDNGVIVPRTLAGVRDGINRFAALSPAQRRAMGQQAQQDVNRYSLDQFHANWRAVYRHRQEPAPVAPAGPALDHRL